MKTGLFLSALAFFQVSIAKPRSDPHFLEKSRLNAAFNFSCLIADTGVIDAHLLGTYKVVKITSGKIEGEGRESSSIVEPEQLTAYFYPKSVKLYFGKPIEFNNLDEKMIDDDAKGRIIHFLCNSAGSDMLMIAIREHTQDRGITLGVINMVDLTYTDYELISIRKDTAGKK